MFTSINIINTSKQKLINLLKKKFKLDIDYKIYDYNEILKMDSQISDQIFEENKNINAEIINNSKLN